MIVKVLSENTSISEHFGCEHGLSLYIETKKHKILFDTGASDLFANNAVKMNVDLTKVDLVVISHGHYDHGGGLKTFLSLNKQAKIYLHQKTFEPHYSKREGEIKAYIGLDISLLPNDRFVFCDNHFVIDQELELFAHIISQQLMPSSNANLLMVENGCFVKDDFSHEQNLIIKENGKTLLIAGCAHKGIINIVNQFKQNKGFFPDFVIGGFHLYSHGKNQNEAPAVVEKIGHLLLETQAKYYTCHCTGVESYNHLKAQMGKNIQYISSGEQFTL